MATVVDDAGTETDEARDLFFLGRRVLRQQVQVHTVLIAFLSATVTNTRRGKLPSRGPTTQ